MPTRVLVIEDDRELGGQIVERLRRSGYEPTWWTEGRRIEPNESIDVELVILDLMLPGAYGLDILKDLRAARASAEVPVLVLSARNDTNDKIRALKLGADDYMTKPFWPDELIERVRARLRRPALAGGDVLDFGALQINIATRSVTIETREIDLTRVEFELLLALARRPGVAVTRAWLAENVLDPEREAAVRTVDVHASRVRKKLGRGDLIETVWGIGYRLAVDRGIDRNDRPLDRADHASGSDPVMSTDDIARAANSADGDQ